MLIIFSVNDQKITHSLKKTLVSGSSGIVQAAFQFDGSWDELKKVIVFSNSHCEKPMPVRYDDDVIDIPEAALKPGKLYVSCVGFGDNGSRKTTQAWDIQQAITVQKCGDLGSCDLLRSMVDRDVSADDVATDGEVKDMLEDVFGRETPQPPGPSEPTVSEEDVASDEDVIAMLEQVFGSGLPPELQG